MSEPRRALWLVPVAELGGVARHVLDATRAGVPGWDVIVLCPEGALAERLREQGSAVIADAFGTEAGTLTSMRTLARVARRLQPEIVHSHLAYADIVAAWTRLPRGTRRFTTEHGIAGSDDVYHRSNLHSKIMAQVHRLRFPRFDGVIAVAHATRDAMITKWRVKQPITVIHNGVDHPAGTARSAPILDPDAPRFLSLSRLSAEKRIDLAIEAFDEVHAELPRATFVIAGDGPARAQLEAQVSRLGLSNVVTFVGFVDPDQAMTEADIIVQLSIWENCSYTLLDAMARGMRIVASRVGGNPEIVEDCALVSGVSPHEVAAAMRSSVHKPTKSQQLRAALVSNADMCARVAAAYAERRYVA